MGVDASNAFDLAAEFDGMAAGIPAAATAQVAHFGQLLHAAIVARAPGTHYPITIRPEVFVNGSVVGVSVGTDRADGWRRELGFHGRDSRGRLYSEAGQAHFGPGFAAVSEAFVEGMGRVAVPD